MAGAHVQLYGCYMDEALVRKTIEIEAPRWAVWEALTEPALLASWLGPTADLAFVRGATGSMVVDGSVRRVRVTDVLDEQRLVWEWTSGDGDLEGDADFDFDFDFDGDGERSEVAITLAEVDGRTVVEVVERRGASARCAIGPAEVDAWDRRLVGLQLSVVPALVTA